MDVVPLEDAADVGLARVAAAQALEGRFLVAEGFEPESSALSSGFRDWTQLDAIPCDSLQTSNDVYSVD